MHNPLAEAVKLIQSRRPEAALVPLRALTAQDSPPVEAHYLLGHALEVLQRWPEARNAWLAAVRLAPAHGPGDLDRILEQLKTGKRADIDDADPFVAPDATDGDSEIVTPTWARVLASQRQYETAAEVYEKLARQHPAQSGKFLKAAAQMRSRGDAESS